MSKILLVIAICLNNVNILARTVCVLVHGTWAATALWHQPGGEFYETLKTQLATTNIPLVDFNWCGSLAHAQRKRGAIRLAELIKSYPKSTQFILVTHSHGGNVGILASQLLKTPKQITAFYALGTPIEATNYYPNLQVIEQFYNLFSFGDLYQTVLGLHQRIFPPNRQIHNISVEVDQIRPQHEDLHCPTLAKWLLKIPSCIQALGLDAPQPLAACFSSNSSIEVKVDKEAEEKLERDQRLNRLIYLNLTRRSFLKNINKDALD